MVTYIFRFSKDDVIRLPMRTHPCTWHIPHFSTKRAVSGQPKTIDEI